MLVSPAETQDSMNAFSCFISFLSAYFGMTSKLVCLSTQSPSLWPSESIHILTVLQHMLSERAQLLHTP